MISSFSTRPVLGNKASTTLMFGRDEESKFNAFLSKLKTKLGSDSLNVVYSTQAYGTVRGGQFTVNGENYRVNFSPDNIGSMPENIMLEDTKGTFQLHYQGSGCFGIASVKIVKNGNEVETVSPAIVDAYYAVLKPLKSKFLSLA